MVDSTPLTADFTIKGEGVNVIVCIHPITPGLTVVDSTPLTADFTIKDSCLLSPPPLLKHVNVCFVMYIFKKITWAGIG